MTLVSKPKERHTMETKILKQALEGDVSAANRVLKYLSSANLTLRRLMQEAIYDLADSRLWMNLLNCLALQRWNDNLDCERRSDLAASQRIDQSIIEVFIEDGSEEDKSIKESALVRGLDDLRPQVRLMAAYLLGLRGDERAIPVLSESLDSGSKDWQLRTIHALESIGDERCGPLLFRALIGDQGEVHREAGRALIRLGRLAESTWLEALDHPDNHIRWHGARGLGNIGDARYADKLAEGLLDDNQAVRWATADVLAHLGVRAVPATLTIISQRKLNEQSRQAVYHALHGMTSRQIQQRVQPLLDALHGTAASIEAPAVAQHLLMEWEKFNNVESSQT
jgi:HEAT repeat protein